jgi:hypothetical protein
VLGDEAFRLDRAEEINYAKPREKNDLLNEKLSSWMIKEIQEKEISSTAIGKATGPNQHFPPNATLTSLTPIATSTYASSKAMIMNFDNILSPSGLSAKPLLPFNEFFHIIQDYSKKQEEEAAAIAAATAAAEAANNHRKSAGSRHRPPPVAAGGGVTFSDDEDNDGGDEFKSLGGTGGGKKKDRHQSSHIPFGGLGASQSLSSTLPADSSFHGEDPPSLVSSSPSHPAPPTLQHQGSVGNSNKGINMMQQLSAQDDQFQAYLKISQGEQLSNKLLSRLSSNLAKPRKIRYLAPLGKGAMELKDSRGKADKNANKGFLNIFSSSYQKSPSSKDGGGGEGGENGGTGGESPGGQSNSELGTISRDTEEEEAALLEEKDTDIFTRLQLKTSKGGSPHKGASFSAGVGGEEHGGRDRKGGRRESRSWMRSPPSRSKSSLRLRQSASMDDDYIQLFGLFNGSYCLSVRSSSFPFFLFSSLSFYSSSSLLLFILSFISKEDIPKLPQDAECDLQSKLIAVWDSLLLSSQSRLTFMEKYSSSVLAAEMGNAIDHWGEVAMVFLLLNELMSMNQKLQVIPLIFSFLFLPSFASSLLFLVRLFRRSSSTVPV